VKKNFQKFLQIAITPIFGMGKTMVMFKNVENIVYSRASNFLPFETHVCFSRRKNDQKLHKGIPL
jgi:hypothetical protein